VTRATLSDDEPLNELRQLGPHSPLGRLKTYGAIDQRNPRD